MQELRQERVLPLEEPLTPLNHPHQGYTLVALDRKRIAGPQALAAAGAGVQLQKPAGAEEPALIGSGRCPLDGDQAGHALASRWTAPWASSGESTVPASRAIVRGLANIWKSLE